MCMCVYECVCVCARAPARACVHVCGVTLHGWRRDVKLGKVLTSPYDQFLPSRFAAAAERLWWARGPLSAAVTVPHSLYPQRLWR